VAEFGKPTMALFANITAADLKKGNIILFAMGSSSPGRVAPRADQCLGGQFACAPMSYSMYSTIAIVNVTNGMVVGVDLERVEKGFYVEINIGLPYQLITNHKKHINNGKISSPHDWQGGRVLCPSDQAAPVADCGQSPPQRSCKSAC
jgi:hypothetical protein